MADIDQKASKALADILALVVDENENVAQSALAKLRQRAKEDAVTGGALKNLFNSMSGRPFPLFQPPRGPAARYPTTGNAERDLASARETIGELTVRSMELTQELSAARSQMVGLMADMVSVRSAQAEAQLALKRESAGRMRAWWMGAATGGVVSALLATVAMQSFPRAPVLAPAPHPQATADLSPVAVPLTAAGAQVGPAAINMDWSNTTANGTRWRVLPSSVASGYSLVIDLGGNQAATIGAPARFMQTDEAARNRSVEALRSELPHSEGSAPPR